MKIPLRVLVLLLSISIYSQQPNCSSFKEGYFKMQDSINGVWAIHRVGSVQIEYSQKTKVKIELGVEWIDKCTYTLVLNKVLEGATNYPTDVGLVLKVEILETSEKSYVQRTSTQNNQMVFEKRISKITKEAYEDIILEGSKTPIVEGFDEVEFKKELTTSVCACFSENELSDINQDVFVSCFKKSVVNYQDELANMILIQGSDKDSYQASIDIGKRLMFDIQKDLINDCDNYFFYLEKMKETGFNARIKDASTKITDSLSILIKKNPSLDLYRNRGVNYLSLGEYDNAEKDFNTCSDLNANDIQTKIMLAMLFEQKKEYSKAAKQYNAVYELTGIREITVMTELAKRKAKEYN